MASYHNNQLNVVGLFDSDEIYDSPNLSSGMLAPAAIDYNGPTDAGNGYFHGYEHAPQVNYGFGSRSVEPERFIAGPRSNHDQEDNTSLVSYTPSDDSDYYESAGEDVSPRKVPKLNKDGALRKPRQPRPKLLKWTDSDWKNVVLGIIWACGEQGVQIPFSQAAELVGENCTASALQQAVLKLRCKQIAEGHHIPVLKMAWTRKNRNRRSSTPIANTKSAQVKAKSPTWKRVLKKVKGSLIVKLKVGRRGIDSKHKQPEAHVLPMNGMQPETSMLSMNVVDNIQGGAHMLPTNDMQPSGLTLPVNNMFSGMFNPAHWAQNHQPLYQDQLQGIQPTQFASPATKLYNRNHFVAKNGLFDEYFNIRGTVEELSHLERINTPERNLFLGEDLINMDNQPAMLSRDDLSDLHGQGQELQYQSAVSDDMHGLSGLHSQGHESFSISEDSVDFPSFNKYEAHSASHENYVPQDDFFKTEF